MVVRKGVETWLKLIYPEEVDRRLNWPLGKAARFARQRKLPHYVLPDGSIRFVWSEVEALIKRVEKGGRGAEGVNH